MVFRALSDSQGVKNQLFIGFLRLAEVSQGPLANLLATMHPCNPRICNAIVHSTIFGRAWNVIKKIINTSTLIGVAMRSQFGGDPGDEIKQEFCLTKRPSSFPRPFHSYEVNFYNGVLLQMYGEVPDVTRVDLDDFCSTVKDQQLRDLSWRIPITGVIVAGAVPQDVFSWHPSTGRGCDIDGHPINNAGYFLVRSALDKYITSQVGFNPAVLPLGPFNPFFGSTTKNKIRYRGGELRCCSSNSFLSSSVFEFSRMGHTARFESH